VTSRKGERGEEVFTPNRRGRKKKERPPNRGGLWFEKTRETLLTMVQGKGTGETRKYRSYRSRTGDSKEHKKGGGSGWGKTDSPYVTGGGEKILSVFKKSCKGEKGREESEREKELNEGSHLLGREVP